MRLVPGGHRSRDVQYLNVRWECVAIQPWQLDCCEGQSPLPLIGALRFLLMGEPRFIVIVPSDSSVPWQHPFRLALCLIPLTEEQLRQVLIPAPCEYQRYATKCLAQPLAFPPWLSARARTMGAMLEAAWLFSTGWAFHFGTAATRTRQALLPQQTLFACISFNACISVLSCSLFLV